MGMIPYKDILIISNLRRNGRETVTNISKLTKIPVSTIFDRLKLREKDLIKTYSLFLDYNRLGYRFRTNILLGVDGMEKKGLRRYLENHFNVNSIFAIGNGFDFLVEGIFKDRLDMDVFLMDLVERFSITRKEYYPVLEEIRHEGFLARPEDVDRVIM